MTDNEIIKALECCKNEYNCAECPCNGEGRCVFIMCGHALDLINRQKAEIERLKKDNEYILMQHKFQRRPSGDCWNDVIEKAKSEAITSFVAKLKATKIKPEFPWDDYYVTESAIDALLEEYYVD